jgi:Transposase DDE domain
LELSLRPRVSTGARHVVVDVTCLKVYGAGEWHAGKYQSARRRAWRKLHLGVDDATKEILAAHVTESGAHGSRRLPTLHMLMPENITQVSGDRAYDTRARYEVVLAHGARATVPDHVGAYLISFFRSMIRSPRAALMSLAGHERSFSGTTKKVCS